MKLKRGAGLFLVVFFSVILASLTDGNVFAEDEVTISISSNSVVMDLLPGEFGEETQTIMASTTNPAGYTIGIRTTGSSSALTNVADNTRTIPTFTLPSGASSIPVAQIGDGYGYSINGGANYYPAPEPSARATTLFKTLTSGSNTHQLTFGVKPAVTTASGTYTNTFQIEIVVNLAPCAQDSICYFGNGDDGTGTMADQSVTSNSSATLTPSNFSRPNYGFAGWNTEIDGSGTSYGPSQTITVGDLSSEGLQLYAMWVQSEGNMQTWHGCDSLNENKVIALTDARDGSTYAIGKYADGKCWMMENLRLDLSKTDVEITTQNTNKPTSSFMTAANNHPASSNSFCTNNNAACVDNVLFNTNNLNRLLTPSYNTNDAVSSWYSYGTYYNYYTATAGNGGYSVSTRGALMSGDICPAGWKLPTANNGTADLAKLDLAYGGSGSNQESEPGGTLSSERWRSYPLNFIFSGEFRNNAGYNRGISTGMNSANNYSTTTSYNLWLRAMAANFSGNSTAKNRGQTVRCVLKNVQDIIGDVHYESNGGTGSMSDQTDVNFATARAANNQFTRANYLFAGWNTSATGDGIAVAEGGALDTVAIQLDLEDDDTLTLYAIWQPVYTIVYNGNGADAGSMTDATQEDITSSFYLNASDFSKTGYGFAGWSADANAATKLQNHETVTIYGPNQHIRLENSFISNADTNNQITLYAVWIAPDANDTMQNFTAARCTAMGQGEILALTDERDGNVYTVSKLADQNCWMTENLRLIPSTTNFTSTNTNNPAATFVTNAPLSQDRTTLCDQDDSACIDTILFNANNINRNLTASPTANNNSSSWYSYGVMYGWYTATAGNGDYAMTSGNVAGDICPAGWRLPTGGTNGEFVDLTNSVGGASATAKNDNMLLFPNNFIYSGDYNYNTSGGRGTYGRYWSATPSSRAKAFRLGIAASNGVTPANEWNKWDGFAVRCIRK